MANKPSSLLDEGDYGNIGKSKEERRAAAGRGNPQMIKLAIVAGCFVIAGGLVAWTYWPEGPPESSKVGGKGALSESEKAAAKKQEQQVQEDLKSPEISVGGS